MTTRATCHNSRASRWRVPARLTVLLSLSLAMILGFSGAAAAQDTISDIDAAQALWADRPSSNYQFFYSAVGTDFDGDYWVVVENDQLVLVEDIFGPVNTVQLKMEDVFAIIGNLPDNPLNDGPHFDAVTGVPTWLDVYNTEGFFEASVQVTSFQFNDVAATASTAAELAQQQAALAAANAAWDDRPSDSYYMLYEYCTADVACVPDTNCLNSGCGTQELWFVAGQLDFGADVIGAGPAKWTFNVRSLLNQIAEALADDPFAVEVTYNNLGVPTEILLDRSAADGDETTYSLSTFAFQDSGPEVNVVQATVTCLGGNGRIDVNMVNESDSAAVYTLQIGSLRPRQNTVQAQSWWRSPVTGRPDGPIDVTVTRDGTTVYQDTVTVACDAAPAVSSPEVQFFTWCIGGNGMIFAQMANPTGEARSYILDVDGLRRSTTASAYGAAFRGISGRPNGNYTAAVEIPGQATVTEVLEINC